MESRIKKAKELFKKYDGSHFYMYKEGVLEEYRCFQIPEYMEQRWREESVACILRKENIGKKDFQYYVKVCRMAERVKDMDLVRALIMWPLVLPDDADYVTRLYMLKPSYELARIYIRNGMFNAEYRRKVIAEMGNRLTTFEQKLSGKIPRRAEEYTEGEFCDKELIEGYLQKMRLRWKGLRNDGDGHLV